MVGVTHAQGDEQRHAAAVALMGIVMGRKFKAAPGLRTKPVASAGASPERRGARGRFVQQFLSARKAGVITQKKELMFYIRGVPTQHGGLRRMGGVSGLVGAYSYARPKPALQGVFDSLEDS